MSKKDAKKAFLLGYYVEDSKVYGRRNNLLKLSVNNQGYPTFSFNSGNRRTIPVHQLLAYQLYGELYMKEGIVCRHLNDIKTDLSEKNIAIGTNLDNSRDYSRNYQIAKEARQPRKKKKYSKPSKYLPAEYWT